eukprot:gene12612-3698_t
MGAGERTFTEHFMLLYQTISFKYLRVFTRGANLQATMEGVDKRDYYHDAQS